MLRCGGVAAATKSMNRESEGVNGCEMGNRSVSRFLALIVACGEIFVLTLTPAISRPRLPINRSPSDVLDRVVSAYKVDNRPIRDVVQELFTSVEGVDMGFEDVLAETLDDPDVPSPAMSLDLSGATLRTALFAICAADPRYTWSIDGATVNVYPQSVSSDPAYLMNRELYSFRLDHAVDIQDGFLAIVHQLPPPTEQVAILQAGGDSSYPPEPWTVTYERVTVRQAINRLAEQMGGSTSWFFSGSKDFRHFAFFHRAAPTARQ